MSCSMTVAAVEARTKTVTRRRVDTWQNLKPGDQITLIEKGMGLRKGERQRVLAEVEIVNVRVEPITAVWSEGDANGGAPGQRGVELEGLADQMSGSLFAFWWARTHGHPGCRTPADLATVQCRRIEWRYVDGPPS